LLEAPAFFVKETTHLRPSYFFGLIPRANNLKQEAAIEKLARANRRRATERKNQRRRQRKRNIAAEQEAELRVGKQSEDGTQIKASGDCQTGKTSKTISTKLARETKQKEDRKWEKTNGLTNI
jgi:hypothetical protein